MGLGKMLSQAKQEKDGDVVCVRDTTGLTRRGEAHQPTNPTRGPCEREIYEHTSFPHLRQCVTEQKAHV